MPKARLLRILLLAVPTVALALLLVILLGPADPRQAGGSTRTAGTLGGPIDLVDHTGAAVTEERFAGRWVLMFFGFTTCPDVCPTELATMSAALDRLGPTAAAIDPVFVSVDPERDTPEIVAGYVGLFDPRLIGLTGTEAQVADAAAAFRVYYRREEPEESMTYLVSHSAFTYLIDPAWEVVDVIPPATPADELAERVGARLAEAGL